MNQLMKRTTLTIIAFLLAAGAALAGSYRVHYSICGSGRDMTVQVRSTDNEPSEHRTS